MKYLIFLLLITISLDAQVIFQNERINTTVLAIELTDGRSISDREIQTLSSEAASISEIEEMIYSPNTQIISIKLVENQKKFHYTDELVKYFHGFLNSRSYVFKSPEHASEVFDKYHHPQANIDKIRIK